MSHDDHENDPQMQPDMAQGHVEPQFEPQQESYTEAYVEPQMMHDVPEASADGEWDAAGWDAGGVDVHAGAVADIRPVPRVSIQAFCETPAVASNIEAAASDRRMGKAHVKVQMGGIPAATEFYQQATTPNLILVESSADGGALIAALEKLAEVCDEGTNVVVIGHRNDVSLYRELISRGVAEYLVAPVSMADVMEIVTTLFVSPDSEPLGNTIAFIGAKGGVGSSTIAHNVAFGISHYFASDVVLADLDLAFGTANIDFDQDPAQGIAEAVFSTDRIDDTFLDRLLAKCSEHLSLLAAPSTLDREYDFETTDFAGIIDIAQRGTPNVVVDLPHMWTGWVRHTLANADKVVITATPDLASLRNTKNLVDILADLRPNDPKPFLVLNQCAVPKRPEISIADFCQPLDLEPLVTLPFDPALFGLAANNGQMIVETDPKHEIAASLETLAQVLTGRRETKAAIKASALTSLVAKLRGKKAA
ncbi:CpaE family protein [Rhizobiaceae bacterium]|nr:CpaE family protein [Rhizobiaceae bacterium]